MRQHRVELGLLVVVSVTAMLASPSAALGRSYAPGFYSGRTGQGRQITFQVANSEVTNLDTGIVDSCNPGTYVVGLYPNSSRIDASGRWSRTAGARSQPTIYHGQLSGRSASGTITDTSDNSRHKPCQGHTTFHTTVSSPVGIGKATVGHLGTDVELKVTMPPASNGNMLVPYTPSALLVYGSNTGCPATYAAADQLARNETSDGFDGLISDAYLEADYETQPYEGAPYAYEHGVFTFHVATTTLLPTSGDQSPFSTVCVMLYSGEPASLTPSRNIVLETARHALVFGPGIPNNQP